MTDQVQSADAAGDEPYGELLRKAKSCTPFFKILVNSDNLDINQKSKESLQNLCVLLDKHNNISKDKLQAVIENVYPNLYSNYYQNLSDEQLLELNNARQNVQQSNKDDLVTKANIVKTKSNERKKYSEENEFGKIVKEIVGNFDKDVNDSMAETRISLKRKNETMKKDNLSCLKQNYSKKNPDLEKRGIVRDTADDIDLFEVPGSIKNTYIFKKRENVTCDTHSAMNQPAQALKKQKVVPASSHESVVNSSPMKKNNCCTNEMNNCNAKTENFLKNEPFAKNQLMFPSSGCKITSRHTSEDEENSDSKLASRSTQERIGTHSFIGTSEFRSTENSKPEKKKLDIHHEYMCKIFDCDAILNVPSLKHCKTIKQEDFAKTDIDFVEKINVASVDQDLDKPRSTKKLSKQTTFDKMNKSNDIDDIQDNVPEQKLKPQTIVSASNHKTIKNSRQKETEAEKLQAYINTMYDCEAIRSLPKIRSCRTNKHVNYNETTNFNQGPKKRKSNDREAIRSLPKIRSCRTNKHVNYNETTNFNQDPKKRKSNKSRSKKLTFEEHKNHEQKNTNLFDCLSPTLSNQQALQIVSKSKSTSDKIPVAETSVNLIDDCIGRILFDQPKQETQKVKAVSSSNQASSSLVENPIAEQNASTSYQHNIEQIATEKEKFDKPLIRCVPTPKLIDFTLPFRDYPVKANETNTQSEIDIVSKQNIQNVMSLHESTTTIKSAQIDKSVQESNSTFNSGFGNIKMKLPLSADVSVTVIEDFDDFGPFSVFQNKKNPSEQSTTMKKKRSDNLSNDFSLKTLISSTVPPTHREISLESAGPTINSESQGSTSLKAHLKSHSVKIQSRSNKNFGVNGYLGELTSNGQFSCPVCNNYTTPYEFKFHNHLRQDLAVKKWKCMRCFEYSLSSREMARHVGTHEYETNYTRVYVLEYKRKEWMDAVLAHQKQELALWIRNESSIKKETDEIYKKPLSSYQMSTSKTTFSQAAINNDVISLLDDSDDEL